MSTDRPGARGGRDAGPGPGPGAPLRRGGSPGDHHRPRRGPSRARGRRARATASGAPPSTCPIPRRSRRALADVGSVDRLALAALDRDLNSVADYDVAKAIRLVTLKLVGYTEIDPRAPRAADAGRVDRCSSAASRSSARIRARRRSRRSTTGSTGSCERSRRAAADPRERPASGDRRGQPVLGAEDRGARGDEGEDADRSARRDARRHRRRRVFLLENPSMHGTEVRIDGGWSLT